jgi:putative transposase
MPENTRLSGSLAQINPECIEREASPRWLMRLGIQLRLAVLPFSDTTSAFETFGVERARSTVHNQVHEADPRPESGRCPDHVAVDETVIRLTDQRYWPCAVVDPTTNELLYATLEPTTTKVSLARFRRNALGNTLSPTPCFSSMARTRYETRVNATAPVSETETRESQQQQTYF